MYWPMPLLGFRYSTFAKARQLNLLYQFWIHTEAIDRLPDWVEKIFNTPSHHRVHHGANKQYIDKNYAGILIIWDRMFKTFEPEIRQLQYGLTKNIRTNNPVKMAYDELAQIAKDVAQADNFNERLRYVFAAPGWTPDIAA
jgi:sterol desaturase/sphingolipid hydroxylase (fatty acid hydroxylase superfamily)